MPVIRYRTRDLTRLLPGTARTMRRMEKITGRTDDMMIVRGVNVFPTQIEELLLRMPALAPHFQCVLTRAGPPGHADRPVERRPATRRPTPPQPPATAWNAGEGHHRRHGDRRVLDPDGVERSAGKMRRIVDNRPS